MFQLTKDQIQQYHDEGFLILRGVVGEQTRREVQTAFSRAVDQQAREWKAKGLIKETYPNLPFDKRYAALREQFPATMSNSWRRILVSPELFRVWQDPALIGIARSLLGDELFASGIWNGRPRAPGQNKQTIDWHQDAHYVPGYQPGEGTVIGLWFPLVPVDERAGCLQVARKSHLRGLRPSVKLVRNDLVGLADSELEGLEIVSCIMNPGDVLVFGELMFHRSVDNLSDYVRWSLDIRYFDARKKALIDRENRTYSAVGQGFICHSALNPSSVSTYEQWASGFTHEGEF